MTYGIRDGDTGEWLTAIYRISGGEEERDEGWEYDFNYPALDEQPDLDPERTYLLVLAAQAVSHAEPTTFYVTIPEHQPGGIFNKILGALNPERWARAAAVWVIEGVHGALCGVLEQFSDVGLDECERLASMSDIITGTPTGLTYEHALVQEAWLAVWIITSAALALIIGWIGLSLILEEPLGGRGSSWRELIPRLLLGLVAAAASLWWCALVIDLAHAASGFIAASLEVTPADLLLAPVNTLLTAVKSGSVGIALLLALIYLIYAFFCLYLLLQMVLRLALIDLLLALAPAAMGLWILPQTTGWSRQWLRMFGTTVAQQAVQLIALALGIGFLAEIAEIGPFEPARDLIWKLLIAVGFVYLATRVPSMLGNGNVFDSWLRTLYFATSLPMNVARSVGTFAALAGAGSSARAAASSQAGAATGSTATGQSGSMTQLSTPSGGGTTESSGRGLRSQNEGGG